MRVVVVALMLAGCATKPLPRVETVEVAVPVTVPCLRADQVPARPVKPPLPEDPVAALAVAASLLLDWSVWGTKADGLLQSCAKIR